jgi:hypothetical protein
MTRKAHQRYHAKRRLGQIKHAAEVLLVLAASAAVCLLVCVVWRICWTVILCPP